MNEYPEKRMKRRVGIMGGTFDPIHIGHLILGEKAYEQFRLEKVLFMPSGNPPHKQERTGCATNEQRVEMVSRAIADNPHFELSLEEMHEQGFNYTRETLERLTATHPDTEYYFIMGADSLLNFETWKDPERICRLSILVAAVRNHMPIPELDAQIQYLNQKFHADIRKLESPNIDVASSTIRQWICSGRSCRYYVPETVLAFIQQNNIYREEA